ncbi:MAG TPA: hypothetical protein VGK73_37415 [Polyangiaceae bacterium]
MSPPELDEPLPEAVCEMLRRDEPEARAVQAAYLRFSARSHARISPFVLLRWLAAGFVAGWGVAFAATGDPLFGAGLRSKVPVEAPPAEPSAGIRANPVRAVEPVTALSSEPVLREAPVPEPSSNPSRRAKSGLHGVLGEPSTADPKWQRAATALKARDYATAESSLRELETAGAPGDRDAASLALAQVLLARGQRVDARARLSRLSATSASPVVREKAAALLAELLSNGERSDPAPAVPQ